MCTYVYENPHMNTATWTVAHITHLLHTQLGPTITPSPIKIMYVTLGLKRLNIHQWVKKSESMVSLWYNNLSLLSWSYGLIQSYLKLLIDKEKMQLVFMIKIPLESAKLEQCIPVLMQINILILIKTWNIFYDQKFWVHLDIPFAQQSK